MKYRLLTPGPTPVPEETLLEMARPVAYHRTPEARAILAEVLEGLRYVFQTSHEVVALTCSGTGAMEAALVCAVPRGAKAICAYAGRFGERWHRLWQAFGIESVAVTAPVGRAVTPAQIEKALAEHPEAKAVCVVHSETSTGVKHDLARIGAVVARSPAILIVDAISSAGAMELRTDAWGLDIVATGSQKALRMPPGLAFLCVSPKAWKQIESHQPTAFYFDLKRYRAKLKDPDTPFTPAHTLLRALRQSLRQIRAEGIESLWANCARLARAARAGVQAMGLELFADPPAESLTAIAVPPGLDGQMVLQRLESTYGLRLAGGQAQLRGKLIRLAHMGHIDYFDVLAGLAGLELVLHELGYPVQLGAAVAAAQRAWAEG
jgi:aspartate aminotransferase-like enzyme